MRKTPLTPALSPEGRGSRHASRGAKCLLRFDLPGLQFVARGDDEARLALYLGGRKAGDGRANIEAIERLAVGSDEVQRAIHASGNPMPLVADHLAGGKLLQT